MLATIVFLQALGAKATLDALQDRYQSLTSFSMTVEHHDDSGLFPGEYVQSLKWHRPDRFELIVAKANQNPGNKAPDYYCDGSRIILFNPVTKVHNRAATMHPEPGEMPGWEVSGQIILSWLQHTPTWNSLAHPPEGMKVAFAFGPAKSWKGEDVREVYMDIANSDMKHRISLYVSTDGKRLVGLQWPTGKTTGWARFLDQRENPDVPDSLGTPPKV